MQHTTLPWKLDRYGTAVVDQHDFEVALTTSVAVLDGYSEKLSINHWADSDAAHRDVSDEEQEGTAAFIVLAANAHYQLVEALEQISRLSETTHRTAVNVPAMLGDIARAALAKANNKLASPAKNKTPSPTNYYALGVETSKKTDS